MGTWGVAQAKAQFSEVIEKAMTEGPQEITKGGKDAVVIVSKKEWMERTEQSKPKQNMAEFLLNSPLRGSGLKIGRLKLKPRKVTF
jgi:prevent-host-death family protein